MELLRTTRTTIVPPEKAAVRQGSDRERQRRRIQSGTDPFRCAYCGSSYHLLSFTSVYGNGSSVSRYRKGLVLKTGWAETKRQTIMAEKCAPPRARSWLGYAIVAVLAGLLSQKATSLDLTAEVAADAGWLAVAAALAVVFLAWWNLVQYPKRMGVWSDSYFCKRCGKVSVISTHVHT